MSDLAEFESQPVVEGEAFMEALAQMVESDLEGDFISEILCGFQQTFSELKVDAPHGFAALLLMLAQAMGYTVDRAELARRLADFVPTMLALANALAQTEPLATAHEKKRRGAN